VTEPSIAAEPGRLSELIARYDRPGPRYTSYPTAPAWSEDFGADAFSAALGQAQPEAVSLYVHIPFCERLCSFCACNRRITRDHGVSRPYLDGIEAEAGLISLALGASPSCVQLSLGGGSPNFLSPDEMVRLAGIVDRFFPRDPDAERSIELDPRNTTDEQLDALVACGFNRVSLGVQDTSAKVQKAINRIQPTERVEALTASARARGMRSVNFDLIYGLPYQTEESYAHTLDEVLALRPDRIALYSYAHVTWISKAQRGFEKKDLPPAERKLAIFLLAMERLVGAGYRFLGMDHFALPEDELSVAADQGTLHRNFMGYTTQGAGDLIALGASGISELADAYAQSQRDSDEWHETVTGGQLATLRGWSLSAEDRRRKWLIRRLMCQGEIDAGGYRERFGAELAEAVPDLDARLTPFVDDALLEPTSSDSWRVTDLGRLFLRVMAMTFDAYLEPPDQDRPRFSRVV
jgi:oxygen-independent coproporphyrinogen-3 oxidase